MLRKALVTPTVLASTLLAVCGLATATPATAEVAPARAVPETGLPLKIVVSSQDVTISVPVRSTARVHRVRLYDERGRLVAQGSSWSSSVTVRGTVGCGRLSLGTHTWTLVDGDNSAARLPVRVLLDMYLSDYSATAARGGFIVSGRANYYSCARDRKMPYTGKVTVQELPNMTILSRIDTDAFGRIRPTRIAHRPGFVTVRLTKPAGSTIDSASSTAVRVRVP